MEKMLINKLSFISLILFMTILFLSNIVSINRNIDAMQMLLAFGMIISLFIYDRSQEDE